MFSEFGEKNRDFIYYQDWKSYSGQEHLVYNLRFFLRELVCGLGLVSEQSLSLKLTGWQPFLFFLKDEGTESEEEKGVIVLRQYEDLEWLYHCLMAHNNIDGVVVS